MGDTKSHRDLVVWQKSMDLATQVYDITKSFPSAEIYGLTAQLRRAAVSIPANIAEGNARGAMRDYARFVGIARGSAMETETLILLSVRLGYVAEPGAKPILDLITEISKMLSSLRSKLGQL